MPLLRQALYAQNINLYLAPTADNRDAWLGLIRTIGVEGRCFVVSSNMSVRGSLGGATQSEPRQQQDDARGRRRNSAFTSDGFEIALPKSPSSARRKPRRKSIIDENGNEIVLCCDEDADDAVSEAATTASHTAPLLVNGNAGKSTSWISRGGSCIVSPFGDVLAGPQWEDDEGIIYADVDMRDCIRGRLDLDAGGSYSRNDAFKFSVEGLDLDPLPY